MGWPQWVKDTGEVVKSWGAGLASFGAFVVSWINKSKIKEVHLTMNSRLDELLNATKVSAHDAGRREGIESEQARMRPADPLPPKEKL